MDNYSNRLSFTEICNLLTNVGFSIEHTSKRMFEKPPIKRKDLDKAFQKMSDEDLMTRSAIIIAKKCI